MQKLLEGQLQQAGLGKDAHDHCCSPAICWIAQCRAAGIGDNQGETYKVIHYFKKSHHAEFLYLCFLLCVARGSVNVLELHLLSLSEKRRCQIWGHAEPSTGAELSLPHRSMTVMGISHWCLKPELLHT